jgi:hypothetical protein
MHYTGMAAMHVQISGSYGDVDGVDVNWFLAPIVLFVLMVVIALVSAVMAVPSEREAAASARLTEQMSSQPEPMTPSFGGPAPASRAARLATGQTVTPRRRPGP